MVENLQEEQIYKCNVCGKVVRVLKQGFGQLICCGQPMKLVKEKLIEEKEKPKTSLEEMNYSYD
jgi:superoxide reductase